MADSISTHEAGQASVIEFPPVGRYYGIRENAAHARESRMLNPLLPTAKASFFAAQRQHSAQLGERCPPLALFLRAFSARLQCAMGPPAPEREVARGLATARPPRS